MILKQRVQLSVTLYELMDSSFWFVIVNGIIYNEGSGVAPGVLE